MPKLERHFFEQPTLELAQNLLGCPFVHVVDTERMAGIIVETEAYLYKDDPACHASKSQTKRNSVMFGPPGCLYVYSIHNRHCMNIVSGQTGQGSAVLIRAIEPTHGLDLMTTHRAVLKLRELTNGPGKLCQSFAIDLQSNGEDLVKSKRVWLESRANDLHFEIRCSPRIGISQARELPYRFFVDGNPFVSGRATDHSRTRDLCLAIPQKVAD